MASRQAVKAPRGSLSALAQTRAELVASMALHQFSTDLILERDGNAVYERIVDAAAAVMRSPYASVQRLHPERGAGGELRLLATRGASPPPRPPCGSG